MISATVAAFQSGPVQRQWPLIALIVGSVFEIRLGRSPSITISEIICLAVSFQMLADWVVGGVRFEHRALQGVKMLRPTIFFGMWMVLCAFLAIGVRSNLLNLWLVRDHFPVFMMMLVLAVYGTTYTHLRTTLQLYLIASMSMVALGGIQAITGGPQLVDANWATDAKMDVSGQIVTGANKARGFFSHPNGLASFFIFPIVLMAATLRWNNPISLRWPASLVGVVLAAGVLYATYAKGAWAWTLIACIIVWVMPSAAWRHRWLPLATATLASLALLLGSLYLFDHGYRSFATILTRVRLWQAAWTLWQSDVYIWMFGNGQLLMPWVSWRYSDIQYPNAHSGLINIPLQYGIPGAALFMGMCLKAYKAACRALRVEQLKRLAWIMMTLLSAYFWNALFEPHLEGGGNLLQFGACLTLCFAIGMLAARVDPGAR